MKRKYVITIVIASLALILDQSTKWLILSYLGENASKEVIPGFFYLNHVTNEGAAFGLFRDMNEQFRSVFFMVVGALAIGMIIYYLVKSEDKKVFFPISLALVLGGALGNIIDRIRFKQVTDFLLFETSFMGDRVVQFLNNYVGDYRWPNFNVADTAIVIGIFGMAIDLLFFTKEESVQETADSGQETADSGQ